MHKKLLVIKDRTKYASDDDNDDEFCKGPY